MKIKVCGMKYAENIQAVAELKPDFMGFIFYDRSPRFALTELGQAQISNLPEKITRVGVFVDEGLSDVLQICSEYGISTVQLHGTESPEFCRSLKKTGLEIIKAFGVDERFDFGITNAYAKVIDCFLFDTKSLAHGGSGKKFDWSLIKRYESDIPYFLSGGIGLEHLNEIKKMNDDRLLAIDVNSRFEIKPGIKNINTLQTLFKEVKNEI